MPPTPRGSPSSRTWSTTTSARAATTCPSSARTFATRAATPGASASISTSTRSARYIVDNALMWLRDYHVDGLRLDAVHALKDDRPRPHPAGAGRGSRRALAPISAGRSRSSPSRDLNDATLILPREAGGYGLTAQWSDDWHHAVHVALTGETVGLLRRLRRRSAPCRRSWTGGFFHDGSYSSFRGREHGAPIPPEVPTWRLVTFAQDHDQIGNRAAGDRLSQSLRSSGSRSPPCSP